MKRYIIPTMLLLLALVMNTACSSDSDSLSPDEVLTPITIKASYGSPAPKQKVAYEETGNNISATWEAGDQIYVVYNGHVNTLTLSAGAGTASATFTGSILGTPKATSVLSCYVKDQNNASALTIDGDGELVYSDAALLAQDGTMAGAAKCNVYSGTTTYGDGSNLNVAFGVNVSMLKFRVVAPMVVPENASATLTYKSGNTEIARASFTVGTGGESLVYMTVPAGALSGEQTLVCESGSTTETVTLSATKANFEPGQTYSKAVSFAGTLDLSTISGRYIVRDGAVITGTTSNGGRIEIPTGATITLRNANIAVSSIYPTLDFRGINTLILEGTNILSSNSRPTIRITEDATLTIKGTGSVTATATSAPAIGGQGSVIIESGNITANGGRFSAGIGGGNGGTSYHFSNITIKGGTVIANGGENAAGIGGGYTVSGSNTTCDNITITGGTVIARGGESGAGIGAGRNGSCGDIAISGGGYIEIYGGEYGAGIGGSSEANCGNITISGGDYSEIEIYGGKYGAGIGAGENGNCGNITITGGGLLVEGGENGAGIGGGSNGTCGDIILSKGSVFALGGDRGAGVGGGNKGACGNITISGASVTADGGFSAAGIGAGDQAKCGNITISAGDVDAEGGSSAAGIGGSSAGDCGDITISGGYPIYAKRGDGDTYDVGPGQFSHCGTVNVTVSVSHHDDSSVTIYTNP